MASQVQGFHHDKGNDVDFQKYLFSVLSLKKKKPKTFEVPVLDISQKNLLTQILCKLVP